MSDKPAATLEDVLTGLSRIDTRLSQTEETLDRELGHIKTNREQNRRGFEHLAEKVEKVEQKVPGLTRAQQIAAMIGVAIVVFGTAATAINTWTNREVASARMETRLTAEETRSLEMLARLNALHNDVQELKNDTRIGRGMRDREATVVTRQIESLADQVRIMAQAGAADSVREAETRAVLNDVVRRLDRIERAYQGRGDTRPGAEDDPAFPITPPQPQPIAH